METARTLRFGFPEQVNEVAARWVAGGVVTMGVAVLVGARWVLIPLFVGFVARVVSGPRFSPLARLVTGVIVPKLGLPVRLVSGSPKRFAQGVGVAFSGTAGALELLGRGSWANVVLSGLVAAASLEAFAGICLGCIGYRQLQRLGVIGEEACLDCADITARRERVGQLL